MVCRCVHNYGTLIFHQRSRSSAPIPKMLPAGGRLRASHPPQNTHPETPLHSRSKSAAFASVREDQQPNAQAEAIGRLEATLRDSSSCPPYLLKADALADNVAYKNDLWECKGKDSYINCSKLTLRRQRGLLSRVQYDIVKASRLGPNELKVRWSISWVPQSMERFVLLGEILPGMKIEYMDILDRLEQETQFKWAALWRFLGRAVFQQEMRIPLAVILGSTTFQLTGPEEPPEEAGKVERIVETWDMVPLVASGRLRNRRGGKDLAAMMDTCRPPEVSFDDWEDLVMAKVDMTDVPGMSPMDVEGLNDQAVANVSTLISLLTVVVLTGGGAAAWVVYTKYLQSQGELPPGF